MLRRYIVMAVVLGLTLTVGWAMAQPAEQAEEPATETQAAEDAPAPEATGDQPDADEVLEDLMRRRDTDRLIEPVRPETDVRPERPVVAPAGTAPDAVERTRLVREGRFVITRRGRMVRASGGMSPWVFVFDADQASEADPPMYLMPCQMLEEMERIVERQGDSAVFIVSGQVHVYRNANYLLPTFMREAPDRGNLQP